MRIFKIKSFNKWASKNGLTDALLLEAVNEISRGLMDANLGGNLYKKRIATKGRGKSGSVRTLLAYVKDFRVFFLFAYEKKELENITESEKKILQELGSGYLALPDKKIEALLQKQVLIEVIGNSAHEKAN